MRGKVLRGVAWKLISQLIGQGSRVLVGLTLARLLTPREFGLAAMAMAFSGFALILADPALTAALVRRKSISEDDKSTVFWTTLGAGIGCTLLGIALAGPIAGFFGEPKIRPLVMVESLSFLFVALAATHVALMSRGMDFKGLEIREMSGQITGAAVGIGLAFGGAGAWAIIGQSVLGAAIGTALLWKVSKWRPRFTYSRQSLRECGSFGSKMLASRMQSYLNLNADNLLIGRFIGSAALGTYTIAYNVMFAPLARLAAPIQGVMIPAFARLQDDPDRLGSAWLRGSRLTAAVSIPGFVGMLAVAPDFVPVVLGHRWDSAIPILQLLCWAGIFQSMEMLQWSVMQSCGRAGTLLRYTTASTICNVIGFIVGLHWGIEGVAAGFAVSRTLCIPWITRLTCHATNLRLRDYVGALATVLQACAVMLIAVLACRMLLVDIGVPAVARLPLLVLLGAATYGALLLWRGREITDELRRIRAGATS